MDLGFEPGQPSSRAHVLNSNAILSLGMNSFQLNPKGPLFICWSCREIVPHPVCSNSWENESESCSIVSDFLQPHGLKSVEFSRPEYGVGSCYLLQGIFPTQGSNPGLLYCRENLYHLDTKEGAHQLGTKVLIRFEKNGRNKCRAQNCPQYILPKI